MTDPTEMSLDVIPKESFEFYFIFSKHYSLGRILEKKNKNEGEREREKETTDLLQIHSINQVLIPGPTI